MDALADVADQTALSLRLLGHSCYLLEAAASLWDVGRQLHSYRLLLCAPRFPTVLPHPTLPYTPTVPTPPVHTQADSDQQRCAAAPTELYRWSS